MKIYKWLTGLMLLGCMSSTWAQNGRDCFSCEDFFCNMRYHVYADYLYWKAFKSSIGIVNNEGEDFFLTPDYSSGYRVGARALWNCLDLGVRYTSYNKSTKHSADIVVVGATISDLKYRVDFQTVDVELGALFCFNRVNSFLRPFAGAKFLWLDEKTTLFEQQITGKLKDHAYGPYVGIEGKLGCFDICNVAIGLRARGSFGLLNGTNRFNIRQQATDAHFASESHVIDMSDVFVGLDISYCDFSCFDLNTQIGYELQSYVRDLITFSGQALSLDNIAFGGLVVRFGVYF